MSEFKMIFYEKEDGTMPAQDFLDSLDDKLRAKMILTVDMLKTNGNRLREPYSKPLDDGIMELRAVVGTNISRVLYFFVVGQKVILTNGFIKKTQKKMSLCLCLAMHNVPVRQATDRNNTNILSVVIFEGTSLLGQFLPMYENSILG